MLEEFRSNYRLFVTVVQQGSADVVTTLNSFQTWINWVLEGKGSREHTMHFYETAVPDITAAVLARNYSGNSAASMNCVQNFMRTLLGLLMNRLEDESLASFMDSREAEALLNCSSGGSFIFDPRTIRRSKENERLRCTLDPAGECRKRRIARSARRRAPRHGTRSRSRHMGPLPRRPSITDEHRS